MLRTTVIVAAIVLIAFLIIGAVNSKDAKDNYAKPIGKVMENVAKDISKGADVTTKEVTKKTKELTEKK
jgi:hypothetical protein